MANMITIARIALIAPFIAFFYIAEAWAMKAAFVVFVIASLTDFLDGYVARARDEVSALGAALDPIADKLLVAAALVLLTRNGVIRDAGVIAAIAILLREILVGGLREALAARGAALPVTGLAKAKTALQLIAIALLLASAPGGVAGPSIRPLAAGLFWLAAALTVWTGAGYTLTAAQTLARTPRGD
ncbi:MAG: CDP-diacylglycerol--glycerol-3-phosphate 3-phosphatidyltransferase [Pseudomonadota bacterium]